MVQVGHGALDHREEGAWVEAEAKTENDERQESRQVALAELGKLPPEGLKRRILAPARDHGTEEQALERAEVVGRAHNQSHGHEGRKEAVRGKYPQDGQRLAPESGKSGEPE